jgi:magnesium and cobalt exporter, CNNM family
MDIFLQVVFVFLLILLNGFFVASEFALVSVRRTRIEELAKKGNRSAILVKKALQDLDSFISATQLGITFASIALGWVGEPVMAQIFEMGLHVIPPNIAFISSHILAGICAFILITFLHIVLGELAPKTIALQRAEKVSQYIIEPLTFFSNLFRPGIWVLTHAGNIVLKILGFHLSTKNQLVHSESEIKMILSQSAEGGAIDKREAEMVYKVFKLGDIPVENIMVHRTEVVAVKVSARLQDIFTQIENLPYSRFPVYENSKDAIIGFIHIKDIYKALIDKHENKRLSELSLIRKIISVSQTRRADDVLVDMRRKRIHIAVVQDDHGGTAGIVTLEDIIENVVGDIYDEFEDQEHEDITQEKENSYLIEATANIERVRSRFHIPIKGQGFTTIGGLVFGLLGREPRVGDMVQIGDISMDVLAVEGKRIKTLRLEKKA